MSFEDAQVPLPEVCLLDLHPSKPRSDGPLDLLAIGVSGDPTAGLGADLAALDEDFGGKISELISACEFTASVGQATPLALVASPHARFLLLIGLGAPSPSASSSSSTAAFTAALAAAGAAVAAHAKTLKARSAGFLAADAAAGAMAGGADAAAGAGAFVRALYTSLFEPLRFKSAPKSSVKLERLELLQLAAPAAEGAAPRLEASALQAAVARAAALARGTHLAKQLVEAPANVCTPAHLAAAAKAVADAAPGCLTFEVLEREACEKLGMGLFLGVSQGSDLPPKLLHMTYTPPGGAAARKLALVGKGLTFDSGGYNIKAQGGIELMKIDMGGAAAVIGAARAIAECQPKGVEVHFIVAACENMVNGSATHPGDIHTAASGKTVEINNTDAEGRLTLADALWFAQEKCGATSIVDIATLTGACMVALGGKIAGLFSNDDALADSLLAAGTSTGERLWRMPLEDEYVTNLKSSSADLKNHGPREGGAITAALFLREFVIPGVQWAHLDIAGPSWDMEKGLPTGFGTGTLLAWVLSQQQE